MVKDKELIVLKLSDNEVLQVSFYETDNVKQTPPFFKLATQEFSRLIEAYPNTYIAWYDQKIESYLNPFEQWPTFIQHSLEILHLSCFQRCDLMIESAGFVDCESPFLLPGPKNKRYVTWLISSWAGIGLTDVFKTLGWNMSLKNFSLALFEFGKRALPFGICPYSEPRLLQRSVPSEVVGKPFSLSEMALFVRLGYKRKWLCFWFLALNFFQRTFPWFSFLKAFFTSSFLFQVSQEKLSALHPKLPERIKNSSKMDVVIPTLKREEHVLNVLEDLAKQTLCPSRVILIEQNPDGKKTNLAKKIAQLSFPFLIEHHEVEWMGACRARNLGLRQATADWILFLDDDVRLTFYFLDKLVSVAQAYHVDAVTSAVYLPHYKKPRFFFPFVCSVFASGASLIANRKLNFDERLEGGYGEDYEFGLQWRLNGGNVLYTSQEPVLHLKASTGGFRFEYPHPWHQEKTQPRPSPTVLYSRWKHSTSAMKKGYTLFYWLNRLRILPPWKIPQMIQEWKSAVRWASGL